MELSPLTLQRGAHPVEVETPDGPRTRILFFDMAATDQLIAKYGPGFALRLYAPVNEGKGVRLQSAEALAYFLWVGFQAECRRNDESLTLAQVQEYIRSWTTLPLFDVAFKALVGAVYTPPIEQKLPKLQAAGEQEPKPAAKRVKAADVRGPGPALISRSSTRSASPSASSAGRSSGSGAAR